MTTTHLISGLPCSGKTTYAASLQKTQNAVLFSLDHWLITAFGRYSITSVGQQEHTRRVLACRELIWTSAAELLRQDTDVILDDGFFLRDDRMRYASMSKAIGALATIHFIEMPIPTLRSRLEKRNANLPPFNFHIDPDTLDTFLTLFEPPSDNEGARVERMGAK